MSMTYKKGPDMTHMTLFALFIISIVVRCTNGESTICSPCVCKDDDGSVIVDCSYLSLTDVPDLCQENVTSFILSGNSLTKIKNYTFIKCVYLRKLELLGSKIRTLEEAAFEGLFRLRSLDLSYNSLGSDPEQISMSGVFKPLRNLETLKMSYNVQLVNNSYRILISLMRFLPKAKLNKLILSHVAWKIMFSKNDITPALLKSIETTSLRILDLSSNRIAFIQDQLCKYTPNLEELSLKINHIHYFSFLRGLQHLRLLDLSEQTADLLNNPNRNRVHNPLAFSRHSSSTKGYYTIPYNITWPVNLTLLKASNVVNLHRRISGSVCINNKNYLQNVSVILSNNRWVEWMGTIELSNPATGIHFDLSDNKIRNLSKHAFGRTLAAAMVSINFKNNNLGELLQQGGGPFQYFYNLKFVDLTSNNIFSVSPNVFNGSIALKLETLIFKNNNLHDIPSGLITLKNLLRLDISNNRILYLNAKAVSQVTMLIERADRLGKIFNLDLGGNPLECSCRSQHFIKWLYKFRRYLPNIENTTCELHARQVSFSQIHKYILPLLDKQCMSLQWLNVTAGVLVTIVVSLTISVIAYRHRWDIKYFCIRLKIQRELYAELLEEEGAFQYDAFIAYNEHDLNWIVDHIIPNLEEGERSFRLCVHHRDFEVGWPIEENILRSISTSRKTIIVLSRHFLRSGWCKFEMHMARIHMMERGVDKLIIVLLEDIPITDMPRTLVAILRRHTYLEWPGEDMTDKVPAFWSRLRIALTQRS